MFGTGVYLLTCLAEINANLFRLRHTSVLSPLSIIKIGLLFIACRFVESSFRILQLSLTHYLSNKFA